MHSRILILLSATALLWVACDKKSEATVVPAPAAPVAGKFSDPGATSFLSEYEGFAKDLSAAVQEGDASKLQPMLAKAGALAAKGREWAAKLKPEELKAYTDKLVDYAKPVQAATAKLAAGALEKLKAVQSAGKEKLDGLSEKIKQSLSDKPSDPAPPVQVEPVPPGTN